MATRVSKFGLSAMKQHPELIPLVSIISTAVVGACGFMGYALYTKPDVRVIRSRGPAHEDVEPTHLRKLFKIHQEVYAIPELEQLKKEIGSYKC